jgi:sortase (surface protein transpeptidase)
MADFLRRRARRNRPLLVLDLLAAGLVAIGLTGLALGRQGDAGPAVRVSGTLSSLPSTNGESTRSTAGSPRVRGPHVPHRAPRRLSIPAVGIVASIVPLGLNPDGTLEVPTDSSLAGWYRLGVRPGEQGPAVIVGHVDSKSGPAVFYRLGELAPGDLARVSWGSRVSVLFRVYAIREYAKSAFPTSRVYAGTRARELRLVTCGGPFDERTGHYLDNVVVFGRLVQSGKGAASGPRWSRSLEHTGSRQT